MLAVLVAPSAFADRAELQAAVDAWLANDTAAEAAHGHISGWDVTSVSANMSGFDDMSAAPLPPPAAPQRPVSGAAGGAVAAVAALPAAAPGGAVQRPLSGLAQLRRGHRRQPRWGRRRRPVADAYHVRAAPDYEGMRLLGLLPSGVAVAAAATDAATVAAAAVAAAGAAVAAAV